MDFSVQLHQVTQEAAIRHYDDSRSSKSLVLGMQLTRWLGAEAGYMDWGRVDLQVDAVASNPEGLRNLLKEQYPVSGRGPYLGARWQAQPN